MIKAMFFIKRRSDLTLEAFKAHYEAFHVPLALENLPLMRKHVRNYVHRRRGGPEPEFDCVTEIWFDDWEALKQAFAQIPPDKKELIAEDEARFIDRASVRSVIAEEQVTLPG